MMDPAAAIQDIRRTLHELSQPLAAVTGLVDLLLLELPPDSPVSQEIQLISQQLSKVLELVSQIRRLAVAASQAA
jgi:signal transduction histidine kinase